VILRHSIFSNHDVTFNALKIRVFASLIDLIIQGAIQVRFNVTTPASPTRLDRYERPFVERIHDGRVMTVSTTQFPMYIEIVLVAARAASGPLTQHQPIVDTHCLGQLRIEVAFWFGRNGG
jgi:hypothetical protein